jgi:hypothetical protein
MTAPLGRNNGGYDGDTIDIDTVLHKRTVGRSKISQTPAI